MCRIKQHEGSNIPITLYSVGTDSRLDHKSQLSACGWFYSSFNKGKGTTGWPVHAFPQKSLQLFPSTQ